MRYALVLFMWNFLQSAFINILCFMCRILCFCLFSLIFFLSFESFFIRRHFSHFWSAASFLCTKMKRLLFEKTIVVIKPHTRCVRSVRPKKKNTFKVCMDSCPKPMGLTHFKKQLKEKFVTLFRWENVIILEKFFSEIYCEILFNLLRLDRRQREK